MPKNDNEKVRIAILTSLLESESAMTIEELEEVAYPGRPIHERLANLRELRPVIARMKASGYISTEMIPMPNYVTRYLVEDAVESSIDVDETTTTQMIKRTITKVVIKKKNDKLVRHISITDFGKKRLPMMQAGKYGVATSEES